MAIHILGIRHHGPGSARNVRDYLEEVQPDIVLIEGPVEANELISWVTKEELKPPVAILCYQPEEPNQAVFYPFAEFSPEWQAMVYARRKNIPVRFMDLPKSIQFGIEKERREKAEEALKKEQENQHTSDQLNNAAFQNSELLEETPSPEIRKDPISYIAEAAGFSDGEKWWDYQFEHKNNDGSVFEGIRELMQELREAYPTNTSENDLLREAYMRKIIREAEREMFQNIAVVCGAWHAPALHTMPSAKEDNEKLKGLPKIKVECTWIPWTYARLSFLSGYGAGILSPGWYNHIWKYPEDNGTRWMSKVAKLLRQKNMDTSVAHVIEAIRLSGMLAELRNMSKPGLEELNEATKSILFNGESVQLDLVHKELIVSNRIGKVPLEIPKPPLQLDIERQQKKLRLAQTADWKDYVLDLRKETDLQRSVFLHRLNLLGINWGEPIAVNGKGTFKEQWRLQWKPELSIEIIEKGAFGNTIYEAASNYVIQNGSSLQVLSELCELLERTIPAELPQSVESLIGTINNMAATGSDIFQLLKVVPGLVNITRYGNVRKTDANLVLSIVHGMVQRICVSLPSSCTGINEEAASELLNYFVKLNESINILQNDELTDLWKKTLQIVSKNNTTVALIAGYTTRLLSDHKIISSQQLVQQFYYAMSTAAAPSEAAYWLEGFLKGSGTILLVDEDLWTIINHWVEELNEENFKLILPLLRRTFAVFTKPERRKMAEKVRSGAATIIQNKSEDSFDHERAAKGIDIILTLFGYKNN